MTKRLPCPPAPGPLEAYAAQFDNRFGTLAQRRGLREYLQGLLLPRERQKTLTGLVGTEPVVGAQAPSVQRLQFFLSESPWDAEAINRQRLYHPLHVKPYTPAERLPKGKADPDFRTKPQLAVELVDAARAAGASFRAVVADCFYGEKATFEGA